MRSRGAELPSASIDSARATTRASQLSVNSCVPGSYRKEAERVACSTKKPSKMRVCDSYSVDRGALRSVLLMHFASTAIKVITSAATQQQGIAGCFICFFFASSCRCNYACFV